MRKILFIVSISFILSMLGGLAFASGDSPPEPPGQADSGYGSPDDYICSGYTEERTGPWYDPWSGTWCWYYVPDVLKNGNSAPVVVYLHGMALMSPDIYKDHIRHLCRQGYIVLFPQINKGGIVGMASDNDQYQMMHRAIDSVNTALGKLGGKAETDNLFLYGHSLGGLIALCWEANEGTAIAPPSAGTVLADPCLYSNIPAFVELFVNINELDFANMATAKTCPLIVLTGNDDDIAPSSTAVEAYDAAANVLSKVVYQYRTDDSLKADHMAPINDDGWMPSWVMGILGGDGEVDTFDYRVFWPALDAALDGQLTVDFDMGQWDDGTPVTSTIQTAP